LEKKIWDIENLKANSQNGKKANKMGRITPPRMNTIILRGGIG